MSNKVASAKASRKDNAREEIYRFAELADRCIANSVDANRFAAKIWRRALKHKIKLGLMGRRICRSCHAWLFFGKNARVRVRTGKVVITCLSCGHIRRVRLR